jgi:hypothetical protein
MNNTNETAGIGAGKLNLLALMTFAWAGAAILTLVRAAVGDKPEVRFTFKVNRPKKTNGGTPIYFVSVLTGPSNENDYTFLGTVFLADAGPAYVHSRKSAIGLTAPSALAAQWLMSEVLFPVMVAGKNSAAPDGDTSMALDACAAFQRVTVYHEGRCCRCSRLLTVPASVASGVGPECAKKL